MGTPTLPNILLNAHPSSFHVRPLGVGEVTALIRWLDLRRNDHPTKCSGPLAARTKEVR